MLYTGVHIIKKKKKKKEESFKIKYELHDIGGVVHYYKLSIRLSLLNKWA